MNKRKTAFTVIAVLIPVLFFVLLELFLTAFDLFPQPPLFYKKNRNRVIEINSNIGERYFNKKTIPVPNLDPQTFSAAKSADTFRIFCLGGSTTAGFPYEMTVPFPQQLKFLLQNDYPKTKFEVINMGLSAINSFTVLDWLPDILEHDPDLIIIYMGHNEFYGAYGTGSTISFGHNAGFVRFVLALKKFRTVQMINSLIQAFVPDASTEDATSATIMEKIAEERVITADSKLRAVTHNNYSENLDLILDACRENSTPVILSSLVSNLKDQPPLGAAGSAAADDASAAEKIYRKGLQQLATGDSVNAYLSFSQARDKDAVPFRADSEINSIVSRKAQEYHLSFVDMNKAFRNSSPQKIPGYNLFCDHLHPTPAGYRLIADEFRKAVLSSGLLPALKSGKEITAAPIMVTNLDWEIGAVRIFILKHSWPFGNRPVDYAAYIPFDSEFSAKTAMDYLREHHVWGRAHSEMAEYYLKAGEYSKACAEYQAVVEMYPEKIKFYHKLVNCAKAANDWPVVEKTCIKALTFAKNKGVFYFNLALSQRRKGRMKEAVENIQKAIDAPELNRVQISRYFYTYAVFLIDIGQYSAARQLLQDLIKKAPELTQAKELLMKLPK